MGRSLLICGLSGSGKSTSLRTLKNQPKTLYLNCDGGKDIPFANQLKNVVVNDPLKVLEYYKRIEKDKSRVFETVVIDTISFLMDMYEHKYVSNATNGMKAWAEYHNYFKSLMYNHVAKTYVNTVFLGHLDTYLNEETGVMMSSVPVKGALKKVGIEAFFTTVLEAKTIKLSELQNHIDSTGTSPLLNITEDEELSGYKHVFQTRIVKTSTGSRVKSPWGMFNRAETYIDNDVQMVLDRMDEFYNPKSESE